jgi:hypothetical protein
MLYLILVITTNTDGTFNYYTYDFRSFASALVAYDRKQAEVTSDTGRASYAIKLMDSTGAILKSEERDLTAIREQEQEPAE